MVTHVAARWGPPGPAGCLGGCLVLLVTLIVCGLVGAAIYFSLKESRGG